MKKVYLLVLFSFIFGLTGCGSLNDKTIKDSFLKEVDGLKNYYMEGTLKINNNDDVYEYNVEVNYKKDDKYKVSLKNKANDYEQIILKNKDGVYVINPSLNKSFKFQSDWPNNNSQSYLLESIANDLKNDNSYKFTQKDGNYVFTIKTNYPNNPKYVKQNIILDKNKKLKKVEVQDKKGITYIEFVPTTIDYKARFNDSQFDLDEIAKGFEDKSKVEKNQEVNETNDENSNNSESSSTTAKIDENIFPLYLPSNTTLSDREVITTVDGERVIMTFSGDNPFILVEETVKPSSNLEIVPTYGEPFMLVDTVGSLTDTSYTWTSGGVEYYIVSDQINQNELLEIAKSINVVSAINQK